MITKLLNHKDRDETIGVSGVIGVIFGGLIGLGYGWAFVGFVSGLGLCILGCVFGCLSGMLVGMIGLACKIKAEEAAAVVADDMSAEEYDAAMRKQEETAKIVQEEKQKTAKREAIAEYEERQKDMDNLMKDQDNLSKDMDPGLN